MTNPHDDETRQKNMRTALIILAIVLILAVIGVTGVFVLFDTVPATY